MMPNNNVYSNSFYGSQTPNNVLAEATDTNYQTQNKTIHDQLLLQYTNSSAVSIASNVLKATDP